MKRFGTMLVAIVALGLLAASSALAVTPNPWKVVRAAATDVRTPADVRTPSDVRQGRTLVVRPTADWTSRARARSWSDGS